MFTSWSSRCSCGERRGACKPSGWTGLRRPGRVADGQPGLYNDFLAAGVVWDALAADPVGFQVKVFFLGRVVVAGLFGGATVSRRILLIQALPAAITLALVLWVNANP